MDEQSRQTQPTDGSGVTIPESTSAPPPSFFAPEIVGWRVWNVDFETNSLLSPFHFPRTGWPKGTKLTATCFSLSHRVPGPSNTCPCGIWATRYTPSIIAPILGLVRLSGEIAVHGEEGWRGQYAQPVALVSRLHDQFLHEDRRKERPQMEEKIPEVADAYGVPVIDPERPGWQAVARELGAPSVGWLGPPIHWVDTILTAGYGEVGTLLFCACGWEYWVPFPEGWVPFPQEWEDQPFFPEETARKISEMRMRHYKEQEGVNS